MTDPTLSHLEHKFNDLLHEHDRLQERRDELSERIAVLKKKIDAFQLVISECSGNTGGLNLNVPGTTLEKALIEYAKSNGGELNSYQVRPLLVDAGLLKDDPRAASVELYNVLSSSDHFEQVGPRGRYRLIPNPHITKVIYHDPNVRDRIR